MPYGLASEADASPDILSYDHASTAGTDALTGPHVNAYVPPHPVFSLQTFSVVMNEGNPDANNDPVAIDALLKVQYLKTSADISWWVASSDPVPYWATLPSGTLHVTANGTIDFQGLTYQPDTTPGLDTTFTLNFYPAGGISMAGYGSVSITILDDDSPYNGDDNANRIDASSGNDVVNARGGDDHVNGLGGNDTISGGLGNDTIAGGAGQDFLRGDTGDDFIHGNGGNDHIYGGDGNDCSTATPATISFRAAPAATSSPADGVPTRSCSANTSPRPTTRSRISRTAWTTSRSRWRPGGFPLHPVSRTPPIPRWIGRNFTTQRRLTPSITRLTEAPTTAAPIQLMPLHSWIT